MLLLGSVFLIVIVLGLVLAQATHNINYLWGGILVSLVMNISAYFYSDKIALYSSGAIEANPDEYAEYYDVVKNLTSKANMTMPRLYIIKDPSPNAFATGRNESNAAIAVTLGLLDMMNRDELEGVLAHELSHIQNKDILIMSVVIVLASVFSYMANIAINMSMSGNRSEDDNNNNFLFIIASVLASVLLPIAMMIVRASISQKREYMADVSGAILADNKQGLAGALQKIGAFNMPLQTANNATAHLYISNPFGAIERQSFWQRLFMTHPPIEERIKALLG